MRDKIKLHGRSINKVEEEIQVEVQPGMDTNTVLTFTSQGNEQYNHPRSSLIIKFCLDDSHFNNYKRSGNNLIYTHKISLREALKCSPVSLMTLDNRIINLNVDQGINPQTVCEIKGEGMPAPKPSSDAPRPVNGNLYVRFDIHFPENMTADEKRHLLDVLKKNASA
jgi:DnaJ-class molecular chaperone